MKRSSIRFFSFKQFNPKWCHLLFRCCALHTALMPPKTPSRAAGSDGYAGEPEENTEQNTMSDAEIARLLGEMESLNISDLDAMEDAIRADQEKMKARQNVKSEQLKQVVSRKSELLKPQREALTKAKAKQRAKAKSIATHRDKASIVTINVYYKGHKFQVELEKGSTIGQARRTILSVLNRFMNKKLAKDVAKQMSFTQNKHGLHLHEHTRATLRLFPGVVIDDDFEIAFPPEIDGKIALLPAPIEHDVEDDEEEESDDENVDEEQ